MSYLTIFKLNLRKISFKVLLTSKSSFLRSVEGGVLRYQLGGN